MQSIFDEKKLPTTRLYIIDCRESLSPESESWRFCTHLLSRGQAHLVVREDEHETSEQYVRKWSFPRSNRRPQHTSSRMPPIMSNYTRRLRWLITWYFFLASFQTNLDARSCIFWFVAHYWVSSYGQNSPLSYSNCCLSTLLTRKSHASLDEIFMALANALASLICMAICAQIPYSQDLTLIIEHSLSISLAQHQ